MAAPLKIIYWPDPRLKKISAPVTVFDQKLADFASQMLELMKKSNGVGLAAPQVGHNIRLFVMNHNGEPESDKVFINPHLSEPDGEDEEEEGCLSLPKIHVDVLRSRAMTITAQDLAGNTFQQTETGFLSRVWQHEIDHLNGILLTDRMGPVAKLTYRKILKDLQEQYDEENPKPVKKKR